MPSHAVHRSVLDDICGRLKWLDRAVFRLQNKKIKTIPIYDKARLPRDMPNGMIFFTADSHQFGFSIDGQIRYATTKATTV